VADVILVLNAGSSSIKFSVFDATGGGLELLLRGQIEGLYTAARFGATDRRGASVGARCKIQSHTFICDGVTIGDGVFVGHGVMFVNDTFSTGGPARGRKELWRETAIGNRVSIGSNATILPVKIVDDVVIGAGSVVTKDITTSGTYAGNPARRL